MDGDVPSGPLLLKLIIGRAHINSQSAVLFLRNSLTQLDTKMIKLHSNVVEFNKFVKAQVTALVHRNQESSNLLINLFKGHEAADDVEFRDLICRMVNDCEEGRDVTVNNLMVATDMKCRARKLNKQWSAPTKEQEQILALTACIEQLKSQKMPKLIPKKPPTGMKAQEGQQVGMEGHLAQGWQTSHQAFRGQAAPRQLSLPHKDQWVCHTNEECSKNPVNAPDNTGARAPLGEQDQGQSRSFINNPAS
jgi:hypothetical protein